VGQAHPVTVLPGTRAAALYRETTVTEDYYCSYGVAPAFRSRLEAGGMAVTAIGADDGEIRIVELPGHPFFLATLFLPQTRSTPARPHPLLAGFADAVRARAAHATARVPANGA
jgi:CTP synthase (UTP-ammonia lyase)